MMSKWTMGIFVIIMCFSLFAHATNYELTAIADVQASDGKLKSVMTSSLVHMQDEGLDSFTLTTKSIQLWMEPRNEGTEEKARQLGTPIDGTVFAPNPGIVMTVTFDVDEKTNTLSHIDKDPSKQATEDLINLMFFKGMRTPIYTENLAMMMPEHAKEFKTKVSEYDVTLYVYWYDSLIRRKDKEAPIYLLFVKDSDNKMVACRVAYLAVKTTSMEVAEFNLCSSEHDIDLNEIVCELNSKLDENFLLKTAE